MVLCVGLRVEGERVLSRTFRAQGLKFRIGIIEALNLKS